VKKREDVLDPEMIEALKDAKTSGKARHIGVSTHRNEPEVIQAAIDSDFYEVVLTTLNFKQDHYQEIFEKMQLAKEKGIGFVAMKVMAGGFLDAEKLRKVNYKAALKWSLQDENIHTTIPSIVNLEQLQDNATVLSDITLTQKELEDLDIASKETGLYCNGCKTCEEQCTKNLPIPDLMRSYMYAYGYHYSSKAKEVITDSNVAINPCADCNQCTVECVKGFNIAQRVTDVTKVLEIPDELLA
jgi:predicted aldo/keto reductase-like oxidoreductase